MNDWDQIRNYLQRKVSADSYDNWLKGTACVGQEGDTLYVSVPDRETRLWLETEYSQPDRGRNSWSWGWAAAAGELRDRESAARAGDGAAAGRATGTATPRPPPA